MINEPMDIDRYWPKVLTREEALDALQGLLAVPEVEVVWNEIVGPLYDLQRATQRWRQGHCVCGAQHPAWSHSPVEKGHRMWCPHYVGPLEHRVQKTSHNFMGDLMNRCSCGQNYSYWATGHGTEKGSCPDTLLTWRGPRPASELEDCMSEQNENPEVDEQDSEEATEETDEDDEEGLAEGESAHK